MIIARVPSGAVKLTLLIFLCVHHLFESGKDAADEGGSLGRAFCFCNIIISMCASVTFVIRTHFYQSCHHVREA